MSSNILSDDESHNDSRNNVALSQRISDEEEVPLDKMDKDFHRTESHGHNIVEVPYAITADGHRLTVGDTLPEVKAVALETDDPEEPCETIRSYFLGTIVAAVGTALNVWFGARQPGIYISPFLAQLLSYPMGVALARTLPSHKFTTFGRTWSLNPGPFSMKEHAAIVMMATVSLPTATAIDVIVAIRQPTFFNDTEMGNNKGFQFLVVLSTQFLGFGVAGLARDYLVYPSAMTWPLNLAKMSLFNALHRRKVNEYGVVTLPEEGADKQEDPPVHGWKVSTFRFCLYAIAGSFCWFFITSFIFPSLTYFNWPTWISPTNKKLAIIMGSVTGLGLNPLPTLDWTYISGAGLTPLITPWWASVSILVGASIGYIVIAGLYFSNTWFSAYLVPNSNQAFDRFGAYYNVTKVLSPDRTLDVEAYRQYSPLYFGAGYNVVIIAYFASYTAILTYAALNHWSDIKKGFNMGVHRFKSLINRNPKPEGFVHDQPDYDIHYALMTRYKEVPQWWFLVVLVFSLVLGIIMCETYDTTMPVWGIFCCLAMVVVFVIPTGIIQAISNMQMSLVILAEIIPGVAIPGRPYANMIFKLYGWVSLYQALLYILDQKLAHYLHLPPRATFRAQMWGVIISSFVSLAIINWQFEAIPDLCVPGQKDLMTCPYYTTFYSSALLFGVVGPRRMYGSLGLYKNTLWGFFAGFALVFLAWVAKKRWPNNLTKNINVPVIIFGAMYFAPYNWSFIWAGIPLAWFFMSYVFKRFPSWWNKYCYVLSIGLTVGAAVSGVIQFFCITYPGGVMPTWWGNTVYVAGCDGLGCPLKEMPEVGYFGPGPGEYL
ncbi:OPT family small oligopeptide transporter [Kwoniella pini CBS 10737]|uniref:OPT family small oligopeptide transporter n=1 Tax=Kwoniella pini CBS 10737 TaxID=1296096 RepID=A0A1B9HVT8_9TREE|nr:OPT family small oligopeptide transporter [Kwoniella pini CBS 10737]OCF47376.1 OPT family small oligopeptide transporter [Kwoniella pini CBS 10737]